MELKDSCKFILGIIKINNADNNLINDEKIKQLLNEEFKKELSETSGINNNNINESKKKDEEKKDNNENKKEEEKNEDEGNDEDFDEVEG